MYCLDQHFRRFLNSAAMAGIPLSMTQAQMYRAIMETAAASEKMGLCAPSSPLSQQAEKVHLDQRCRRFRLNCP